MSFARNVLAIVAVVASLAGVAIKTQRYSPQFAGAAGGSDAALAAFMTKHGWNEVAGQGAGYPFSSATFARPGCSASLVVGFLGAGGELADDFKLAFGANVAFIERGRRRSEPADLYHRLTAWMATKDLLGVAPAPATSSSACGGPGLDDWPDA